MIELTGIGSSGGIGIGKTYILKEPDLSYGGTHLTVDEEKERLQQALDESIKDVTLIKERATANLGADEAKVFDAHLMILQDPEVINAINTELDKGVSNAEDALMTTMNTYKQMFSAMTDNPYMQERASDVRDVAKRVLSHLVGNPLPSLALIAEPSIVVADELTPSDTAQLDKTLVKGFVTRLGGRTSHSAIMARTLEIPAVVGTSELDMTAIKNGVTAVVNGTNGEVTIEPSKGELNAFKDAQLKEQAEKEELANLVHELSRTSDGKQVELAVNIGTPDDTAQALENGAEGVGLMRSEFLYMDKDELPDEDTQYLAYKQVVTAMAGKQVTIRTMDIGGDKHLPYLPLPDELNPFLGYRAIRISLDQQAIFKTQIKALLRASAYGNLRIMFPMIATLNELRKAKQVVADMMVELDEAHVPYDPYVKMGMMIEVPSTAILADQFAKEVDFFSIGTNDLIQYTFASDRGNERVSYLYQPLNPALLRLINHVVKASHDNGITTGMCGEMASDPLAIPLLLAMGLDEFSMSATSILKTRKLVKEYDTRKLQELLANALQKGTTSEVEALVEEFKPDNK